MGKTVVMFPGQGSQFTGMGRESYNSCTSSVKCFKRAGELTGINMEHLIFEENELLNKTEYTQIALYVTEIAQLAAMVEQGLEYDAAIGLSLGEYGALTASGALAYEDGVRLVRNRGIYMEQEVPAGIGAMAAVIGLTADEVDSVLSDYNKNGYTSNNIDSDADDNTDEDADNSAEDSTVAYPDTVSVANYNCPGQIVISGKKKCVKEAMEMLKEAGARRTILLNVSGPFHSMLLKGAGDKLMKDLAKVTFDKVQHPYVANSTAEYVDMHTDSEYIKELLSKQVYSPVYFEQSIRKMLEDGYDTFIEVGPGKTLSGFVKKIAKSMEKEVSYECR